MDELKKVQKRTKNMIKDTKLLLHTRNKCISWDPFSVVKGYLKAGMWSKKSQTV